MKPFTPQSAIFALEVGPVIAEHLHKAQPVHSDPERFAQLDAHIRAFRNRK